VGKLTEEWRWRPVQSPGEWELAYRQLNEGFGMNLKQFVDLFFRIASEDGYRIETNRKGQTQVDFGHKKLHSGHLERLFPDILCPDANIARLVAQVAPGRPCAHRPTKEIVQRIVAMTGGMATV
jgi:hypothetical protein